MPEGKKIDASGGCDLVTPKGVTSYLCRRHKATAPEGRGGFLCPEGIAARRRREKTASGGRRRLFSGFTGVLLLR